jgi:hypothetical protein
MDTVKDLEVTEESKESEEIERQGKEGSRGEGGTVASRREIKLKVEETPTL